MSFTFCNHKFCIATFYCPPSSTALYFDHLYLRFNNWIFLLVADFNIDYFFTSHFLYPQLQNVLDSFCLTQVVIEPTHILPMAIRHIDLALLSNVSKLIECNHVPPLSNSDHFSVEIKLKAWNFRSPPINQKRRVWKYVNADFDKACTVFHPSFSQVQPHQHKLHSKIVLCSTLHLYKLHNKWILYCVPPLIFTSCITVLWSIPHLHKFKVIYTSCKTNEYCTLVCTTLTLFAQVA